MGDEGRGGNLEFVLEEIVAIGQFAVEAEEFLFFFAEGLWGNMLAGTLYWLVT
jgi:hypothetical protein